MRRPGQIAFSLIEVMIAILFVSIAFFGYVALHSRLLHSGQQLEEREIARSGSAFIEAVEVARISLGYERSVRQVPYRAAFEGGGLYEIDTVQDERSADHWKTIYPPDLHPSIERAYELSPTHRETPYGYSWEST